MNYIRKFNMSLSRFTTIKIGGIPLCVYFPLNKTGIIEIFKDLKNNNMSFFILGGGSNVIINDKKIDCAVIMTANLTHTRFNDSIAEVESGIVSSTLSEIAVKKSLSGLEFCFGLPGSIGGAIYMNARAYDTEIGELVKSVEVYDYEQEKFIILTKEECCFTYKNSVFQNKPYFIYKVELQLNLKKNNAEIRKKMEKFKHERKEKGHFLLPSAGCAFKNNYDTNMQAGKIIDELGFKGHKIGGIKVSEKHANFLVNTGGGSYGDYIKMVEEIKKKVKEEKGIDLECEVKFLP